MCVCVFPSELYHYKDLQDKAFGRPYGLCGLWEASCNLPNYTGAHAFFACTYDVISHLIAITSMSAEVADIGAFCILLFILFYFISFICILREGGMGEERGAPREKNESAADRIAHYPSRRFFNSSHKFPYISWSYSGK